MSYYKADTVREAANGNWLFILAALAPHLEPALRKPGRQCFLSYPRRERWLPTVQGCPPDWWRRMQYMRCQS